MFYSKDYIRFIKNSLVNYCYMEYCKEVYNKYESMNDQYVDVLLAYKNEVYIWENVFTNINSLFTYYLHLSVDHLSILNLEDKEVYSQNRLSKTYEQVSFQDYIDEHITFQKVGYREYQNFIKSMKVPEFKNKMIAKYHTDSAIKTLKNHIIYVVNLQLSKQINPATMFTNEEQEDIETNINAIHFFEHLSENNWTTENIDRGMLHTEAASMDIAKFYTIEEISVKNLLHTLFT